MTADIVVKEVRFKKYFNLSKEMPSDELVSIQKDIGIRDVGFAEILGVSVETLHEYKKDKIPPPSRVAVRLLHLLDYKRRLKNKHAKKYRDKDPERARTQLRSQKRSS